MAEVAKEAGVTQATVSLALRGSARISPETRARVEAAARKLKYRPDPLVSALMSQRRGAKPGRAGITTLGVVSLWPDPANSWLTLPFYASYREGVAERAERLGYRVNYFACDGSSKQVRAVQRAIRTRGIEGVIFPQAHVDVTELPFDVSGWAAAYIGNGIRSPLLSRVDAAQDYDFRLAWRQARARGFRRVGFATSREATIKNAGAWMGAYLNAQRELDEADRLPPFESETLADDEVFAWVARWKPDAVMSDSAALLRALRKKFPAVGVVSVAGPEEQDLPSVQVGRKQIGAAAVDLVVAQLARGERGVPEIAKRVLIEGWWSDGKDAGAPTDLT